MNKLRYRLESMMPSNATLDPTSGRFRWTPTQSGEYSFTIFVDDDGLPSLGDQQTFTVSVGEVFSPPDLPQLGSSTIAELQTLEYPVAAVASRPAQAIRYDSAMRRVACRSMQHRLGSLAPHRSPAHQLYTITVEAFDADRPNLIARTNWQVTTLEVNSPPILTQPASITLDEETLATMQWIAKDNDLPANTLRFEAVDSLPVGASLSPDGYIPLDATRVDGRRHIPYSGAGNRFRPACLVGFEDAHHQSSRGETRHLTSKPFRSNHCRGNPIGPIR